MWRRAKGKPTLFQSIARQHLWASAFTLVALMLGLLAFADFLTLAARGRALARELRAIESVDISNPEAIETLSRSGHEQGGMVLVDEHGGWTAGNPAHKDKPRHADTTRWDEAREVLAKGEMQGRGQLPWVSEPVVWAARVMYDPDGDRVVLVDWHYVSAVRASALRTSYALVVLAVFLAAAASVGVALRSGRGITRLLDSIAESSTRMAAGDYQIHLPSQPVAELDRVSQAVNRLAADLHAEHDRLLRLERLQRQFVADASHELRAPLTAMRVTIDAWLDGVLQQEEQPGALARLQQETDRLSRLVTRLLDLSRIESGREALATEAVGLACLAAEVAAGFHELPGADIEIDLPSDIPRVWADRAALGRILQNLVENARRFTPVTGSVRIWGVTDQDRVRLGVIDTGCGIASDFLPRIWDRFARMPGEHADQREGSGLGLAIVKALAQAMGGDVGVESVQGVGTTVWVVLPAAAEDLPEG